MGLVVWQSNRYQDLDLKIDRLEQAQAEWVESNKRLIADITEYSSPQRIEPIARDDLDLRKIRPENVLQIKIEEGKGRGF
ncbi:MAG: septum formation initiator family protein [Treponema sp.]|nr:septum formation initiator family protein [Treponema sp.]